MISNYPCGVCFEEDIPSKAVSFGTLGLLNFETPSWKALKEVIPLVSEISLPSLYNEHIMWNRLRFLQKSEIDKYNTRKVAMLTIGGRYKSVCYFFISTFCVFQIIITNGMYWLYFLHIFKSNLENMFHFLMVIWYNSVSIKLAYSRFWKTKSHTVKCSYNCSHTVIKVTLWTTVGISVWAGY